MNIYRVVPQRKEGIIMFPVKHSTG